MISKKRNLSVFLVVAFSTFLATFNETFLNVALSEISLQLNASFSLVQWLVTAYMLGAAIMIPVAAFLYRKFPTKILFLVIITFFVVGSLIGALSGQNFTMILIGRVIQAIGSGMLIPVCMNIVLDVAPREKLGTYMGLMGAMTTLGPSLSVIVAGLLLSAGDFHILFWVFGALSLICLILGAIFVGNVAHLSKPRLDVLSVILISFALVGILGAISFAFSSWVIALIALGVGLIAGVLFVLRQKRVPDPLINFAPLKVKAFSLAVVLNMLALIIVFAFNVLLPQHLQSVQGVSALIASLALFPAIFLSCLLAPVAGKIYDKKGPKWLFIIGFVLMAVFAGLLAAFIVSPSVVLIGALYVPVVIGSALIIGPVQTHGLSALKREQNPHGVTIFSTAFQIAGCIGTSIFASAYAAFIGTSTEIAVANNAFLIVGVLVAVCGVIGLILTFILNSIKKSKKELSLPTEKRGTVASLMQKDVYTILSTASILDAMKLFVEKKISGCPVLDEKGIVVGFISDGDIVRFLSKNSSSYKFAYAYNVTEGANGEFENKSQDLLKLNVLDVASKDLFWIDISEDLGEVCRVLANMHKKKVPVIENGNLVGIITRSDITKYVMSKSLQN